MRTTTIIVCLIGLSGCGQDASVRDYFDLVADDVCAKVEACELQRMEPCQDLFVDAACAVYNCSARFDDMETRAEMCARSIEAQECEEVGRGFVPEVCFQAPGI